MSNIGVYARLCNIGSPAGVTENTSILPHVCVIDLYSTTQRSTVTETFICASTINVIGFEKRAHLTQIINFRYGLK